MISYNVSQLLKEPIGSVRSYTVDQEVPELDPSLVMLTPISGGVKMLRTAAGVLVTAHLHIRVGLQCVRCLDPVVRDADFSMEEEFRPSLDIHTGLRLPIPPGEAELVIDDRHLLDLTEVVRQDLILSLPPYPTCRPHCRGLCPVCGQNLNDQPEHSHQAEIDPRLEVLKTMR
ncbi:MAG: DUF177 domain-containing protein [Chloroflexi bacterium]|nr:DUF177 domain-containing protein [Chloroflexota bacterium]